MLLQQGSDQLIPCLLVGQRLPCLHRVLATQFGQAGKLAVNQGGVVQKVRVVFGEQLDARGQRDLKPQAGTGAHGHDERIRYAQRADFLAFRFHKHRARRVEAGEGMLDGALEIFLRGLRLIRQRTQ